MLVLALHNRTLKVLRKSVDSDQTAPQSQSDLGLHFQSAKLVIETIEI